VYVPGELTSWKWVFHKQVTLYASANNPGAEKAALALRDGLIDVDSAKSAPAKDLVMNGLAIDTTGAVLRAGALGGRGIGTFFLYLNGDTWIGEAGERLAGEVRIARRANVPIVLVHENDPDAGACEFGKFFSTTPGDLIQSGLYSALALAFYPGPARHTSCCLIARTLNAKKISRVENLKQSARVIAAPAIRAKAAIGRRSSVGMAVMASSFKDGARRAPVTLHHAESAEAPEPTTKKGTVSSRPEGEVDLGETSAPVAPAEITSHV